MTTETIIFTKVGAALKKLPKENARVFVRFEGRSFLVSAMMGRGFSSNEPIWKGTRSGFPHSVHSGDEWLYASDLEEHLFNLASTGVSLIAAERAKHAAKGYDAAHDAEHQDSELAWAACYYILPEAVDAYEEDGCPIGPNDLFRLTTWGWKYAKRYGKTRIEQLITGGSFIAAEIDRLKAGEKKGEE